MGMIRKSFNFRDSNGLRQDLLALKDSGDLKNIHKMFFQIYSSVLEEDKIKPVIGVIEEIFPDVPWIGNSTSGNIVDSELGSDIVVSAMLFEDASSQFEFFQYDMQQMPVDDIAKNVLDEAAKRPWVKGIEIYYTISNVSTTQFCDGFCRSGILIVFYGGINFYLTAIKISGWQPLGRTFRVTRASGSVVYELDGRPAYEVYHKYLNIANDENFFMNALEFPMFYEHNGTTIVRAPAECRFDGAVVMSSDIEVGSDLRLSYGEPNTIVNCVEQEGKRIDQFCPEVVHIFSCAARKAFWSSREPTYEIYSLKKIAANSGFFSHGEFLRENGHLNQHNITLVMAGMREGEPHVIGRPLSQLLDEKASPKLPLAARMATFIQEASKDLEDSNKKLQQANEALQQMKKGKES